MHRKWTRRRDSKLLTVTTTGEGMEMREGEMRGAFIQNMLEMVTMRTESCITCIKRMSLIK